MTDYRQCLCDARNRWLDEVVAPRRHVLGLEVGVRDGEFSREVLARTGMCLHGLDRFHFETAHELSQRYPGRYAFHEGRSPNFAAHVPDGHYDFIYIDADHGYDAVCADLKAWWPKLAPGGCLAGDDYAVVDNPSEGPYGVVEAVNRFIDSHGLVLHVTDCRDDRGDQVAHARANGALITRYLHGHRPDPFTNPTWYVFRPEVS